MINITVDGWSLGKLVKDRLRTYWNLDNNDLLMFVVTIMFNREHESMFNGLEFDLLNYADNLYCNDMMSYHLNNKDALMIEKIIKDECDYNFYTQNHRIYLDFYELPKYARDVLECGSFLVAYDYDTKQAIFTSY